MNKSSHNCQSSPEKNADCRVKRKLANKIVRHLQKYKVDVTAYGDISRFNDPNIMERFVWRKKIETCLQNKNLDVREFSVRAERLKQCERTRKLEAISKRKEEREREKAQVDDELRAIEKERIGAEGAILDQKEEEYHIHNSKFRAEIRLRDGRPEPFDLILKNFLPSDETDMDWDSPFTALSELSLWKLEDVARNVAMFRQQSKAEDSYANEFWQHMTTVIDSEIETARRKEAVERVAEKGLKPILIQEYQESLHYQVLGDLQSYLQGKRFAELEELENNIITQMDDGLIVDAEFWESVLKKLRLYKATDRLRVIRRGSPTEYPHKHDQLCWKECNKNDSLVQTRTIKEAITQKNFDMETLVRISPKNEPYEKNINEAFWKLSPTLEISTETDNNSVCPAQDLQDLHLARSLVAYKTAEKFRVATQFILAAPTGELLHNFAPCDPRLNMTSNPTLRFSSEDPNTDFKLTRDPDIRIDGGSVSNLNSLELMLQEEPLFMDEEKRISQVAFNAMGGTEKREHHHYTEIQLQSQIYWWHDKYRPRMPKYFNRVHTGYEWNKYNQAHYDSENPPPKMVVGYKFNIFYPDLIDENETPQYFIEKDQEVLDGSTCILRFHAGPPYEDIGFTIQNKEWETGQKKGFRCVFEKGVLHLYFNFMRLRYRR